jgi:formate dehydrogenase assembly factor FdhD
MPVGHFHRENMIEHAGPDVSKIVDETLSGKMAVQAFQDGRFRERVVPLVRETKVPVYLNGTEVARLLALNTEVEELGLGFLFTECFFEEMPDVQSISRNPNLGSVEVRVKQDLPAPMADFVEFFTNGGRGRTRPAKWTEGRILPVTTEAVVAIPRVLEMMRKRSIKRIFSIS